ncbi:putative ATP-dependent RNA helicase spindle-E [Thelohanellus kitauei]|uniref:Putative ATP-dependent RNA helicase spindle-E n=1 Tax=Thelohanellus kitauei TaxID=669202 RepID=A0A0C2M7D0_THEKT|nr:putative ATP-dependent RNA helicase spindle-E [Thelohanellus kitauei]
MKNIEFDDTDLKKKGVRKFLALSSKLKKRIQNDAEQPTPEIVPKPLTKDKSKEEESLKLQAMKRDYESAKSKPQIDDFGDSDNEGLNDIEPVVETVEKIPIATDSLYIYDNYDFNYKYDESLPVFKHREEILKTIQEYPVCVIAGSTGSGKTTVIPQFIIDSHALNRTYCNILITQPRRVAAISTATRVSMERGWPLGTVVGYSVSLNRSVSDDTRLFYVTTGVLLQSLVSNPYFFHSFSHIIIDEVHERTEEIDLCLMVIKNALSEPLKTKVLN